MTRRVAKEPRWVQRAVVEAMHYDQIAEHGGLPGIRDAGALDAALARARNKWLYESASLSALVAAYGFGLARSHPFNDGNKRIAFLAMAVFAERNGYTIQAADGDVVETIVALAAGALTEAELDAWVAARLKKPGRSRRP